MIPTPDTIMPWDYLVLTASNDRQAAAYREQLNLRRRLQLLNASETLVVADPGGRRVGSGGSTIGCLLEILNRQLDREGGDRAERARWEELLRGLRILIIHAGGDSRRLPTYGPCGKTFIPLPLSSDSALGTTLFDRQLPTYLQLPPPAEPVGQVVITSGDVLLDFDPREVPPFPAGMTGLGCSATPEQASHHGVYCVGSHGLVRRFLQKPSPQQQAEQNATDADGRTVLDIGVIHFDSATALRLLDVCCVRPDAAGRLAGTGPIADSLMRHGLDFYREICCALGSEAALGFYRSTVRQAGSTWADDSLEQLFAKLDGIPFYAHVLERCDFLHFGTASQIVASGLDLLQHEERSAMPSRCLSINNVLDHPDRIHGRDVWVEGCSIRQNLTLDGNNIVAGVDVEQPLQLPPHACLDVLPGRNRSGAGVHFVRCYHDDDPLEAPTIDGAILCGVSLSCWLKRAAIPSGAIWDPVLPPERRCLWNARIFPAEGDHQAYRRWLWMFEPEKACDEQYQAWRDAERYSLEEMATLADHDAFHQRRLRIRDHDLRRSVGRYFRARSGFSAADLAFLLSHSAEPWAWIAAALAEARRHAEREISASPEEAFAVSRILHTLGSAVKQYAADCPRTDLAQDLPDSILPWLAEANLSPQAEEPLADWAVRLHDAAFDFQRRRILRVGVSAGQEPFNVLRSDEILWGRAPARLDLAGGWSDTPPYALEHGGCVLNIAVDLNGQPPIQAYARVVPELHVRLRSIDVGTQHDINDWDDLLNHAAASSEFSLVKAALAISGFSPNNTRAASLKDLLRCFGGGIELTTLAAIPKGSGLGTSSIMGAVLMAVIHRMLGRKLAPNELFHAVLQLEQAMTTGGGWQDQVGGSVGGLKLVSTRPGLVPQTSIRYVPPDVLDPHLNAGQTLLYYTGVTRLAKNILQQVVGRYLDRNREAMATLRQIYALAPEMAESLAQKDLPLFGRLIDRAWRLNKQLDPHSSNPEIESLLARVRPSIYGAKLLGAGGGGFLLLVCKSPEHAQDVRHTLTADPSNSRARFFDFEVSSKGLCVSAC